MAGEQEPRGPRRTQRRAGAGGVPAAEQLLPTADVMFKLWPGRLFRAEHGLVLLLGQAVQRPDVLRGKGLLWGQRPRNAVREHANHRIRDFLRHVQLVQADDHGQPLLMGQFLQDGQQLDLALDVQKGGGLVQQQHFRLLADGAGQQNTLTGCAPKNVQCRQHSKVQRQNAAELPKIRSPQTRRHPARSGQRCPKGSGEFRRLHGKKSTYTHRTAPP